MGNVYHKAGGVNDEEVDPSSLETYLNNVYEKECLYEIKADEVEFIQTGIETLVQKVVDRVLDNLPEKDAVLESQSSIIKVGSIYEGTKNKYPNEFDFIFIYHSRTGSSIEDFTPGFSSVYENIKQLLSLKKNTFKLSYCRGKRKLYFRKRLMRHGPAEMLEFMYKSSSSELREIHVDLVPAVRVLESKLDAVVGSNCTIAPFRAEILSAGKYLVVDGEYSFTETEVHFVRNILSENHRRVYMLLKYLINGHGDHETLDHYLRAFTYIYSKGYTSYMIKTMMIIHHYKCKLPKPALSPCVLQVMEDMCTYTRKGEFPRIVPRDEWQRVNKCALVLRNRLKSMTDDLRSLRGSENCYDFKKIGIKGSVSRQYIDSKWSVKLTKA